LEKVNGQLKRDIGGKGKMKVNGVPRTISMLRQDEERLKVVGDKIKKTTETRGGDPRYLDQIAWCIETRAKITGVLRTGGDTNNFNKINSEEYFTWQQLVEGVPEDEEEIRNIIPKRIAAIQEQARIERESGTDQSDDEDE